MGVYDYLVGSCPTCGDVIENQIKWFVGQPNEDDCFRGFQDELAGIEFRLVFPLGIPDGEYATHEWPYCKCKDERMLYAVVSGNRFIRFTRDPEGETQDINYERHAIKDILESFQECERNLLKPYFPDYPDTFKE